MDSKKDYEVLRTGSYGKKGDVIKLEGDLTERQKIMLKPYEKPVSTDEQGEKKLKAEIEKLKAENAKLKAEKKLEVATP